MDRNFTTEMQVETHLHTNASLSDGAQSFERALKTAEERGMTAIAITNHGNAADLVHAWHWMKEHPLNVRLLFGIEAYIGKETNLYDSEEKESIVRQHLVLLARTNAGYQDFCRFISDTERNKDTKGFPVGTMDMLRKHFAGKDGVICSSACFAGPIAYELLYNDKIQKEINKIRNRMKRSMEALGEDYIKTKERVGAADAEIALKQDEINELEPVAKKKFAEAKKVIKAETDPETKERLQDELDVEILQSKEAKNRIAELKAEIKTLKDKVKDDRKYLTSKKNSVATLEANEEAIKTLESNKRAEDEMYENAKKVALEYQEIFGRDNFYIELMYHGWDEEAYIAPKLVQIAKEIGAKTIATNDVHMAYPDDFKTREYIQNIAGISQKREYRKLDEHDKELYLKTAEEKYEMLCQVIDEADAYDAIVNSGKMVKRIEFSDISSFGHHYPTFLDADVSLKELAETGRVTAKLKDGREIEIQTERGGIKKRYGNKWNEDLQKRFEYELSVISQMEFSSYFLYIADVLCKCKHLYGTPIGPGRGSGAGSIVCYLTTITELEPIELNLLFERFLNPSRVSLPKHN